MSDREYGLYFLAENLKLPLYELKERMPISEYLGWIQFYARQNEEAEAESKGNNMNLLDNPDSLIQALTRGDNGN